ncbi:uncharacterized protein LOC129409990 isoform X1 [Boleophthalmus pectinirostris]|uniref:uncharacterized protein LOC129409990 isoform X1 n=1 Tax=Boleophthalmus pectinirostris TaxID=150288 RepID=UPI00242BFF58|nr:uncharacterized protein LOC129409990 isoform X1 [Boleophthalmus pectinirostris]XP_055012852.1 uncharacterized protein LOC129409990 isoform X1 [Boleophthalmus pectinirostris]XP_055012853.1 uncharacterized protein LOC129409990 isoform X1 [Boleophthalmus pectinirostris]
MATVYPGELKKHCRRRTRGVEEMRRMISRLLESVWDLTDTTGLCLVSHDSMRHIWEMQQKQLECFQDPPGVALYTKVGTFQKGGKELDILRCGWRCNATHMQMYMLEGLSRWNMGGAEGASTLRSFDVRPMSHLNSLSQRVRGCNLVAEFPPPGKPTDERIAVEYLLGQTNRGDLLAPWHVPEIPSQVLEEEWDADDADVTVDMSEEGATGPYDQSVEGDTDPEVVVTETSPSDTRGVVGWEADHHCLVSQRGG